MSAWPTYEGMMAGMSTACMAAWYVVLWQYLHVVCSVCLSAGLGRAPIEHCSRGRAPKPPAPHCPCTQHMVHSCTVAYRTVTEGSYCRELCT